ncbi:hypothetical protein [Tetragenococcus halophilus]
MKKFTNKDKAEAVAILVDAKWKNGVSEVGRDKYTIKNLLAGLC